MNTPGPTAGILSRRTPDDPDRLFGPPTGFFEECSQAAASLGLRVVVFDAADVSSNAVTPAAFTDGRWRECGSEPWPQVIYDRAPVADPAYSPEADRVRARFVKAGLPFINPLPVIRFAADKWAAYRRLSQYRVRLPDTACLTAADLDMFLDRYAHVYVKPVEGSLGAGIVEITMDRGDMLIRMDEACYRCAGKQAMHDILQRLLGNRVLQDGVYLVQQGISAEPPARRLRPRFDLRVLMQQDGRQRWGMTGVVARVCQTDVPTTNLSTGARAEEAESILDSHYGQSRRATVLERVASMSLTVCERLEQDLGAFGEIGLDIIPDQEGEPWLLEINAKPGRNVFKRIAHSEEVTEQVRDRFKRIRRQSVITPFQYAGSLITTKA